MRFGTIAFVGLGILLMLVGRFVPGRWRLAAWTAVVIAGVVPWGSWVGHEHWARVEWVPFTQIVRARDLVLNLALYLPIGYFIGAGGREVPGRRRLATASAYALILSLVTEWSQVYSHGRFPAMTDVTMNTLGAIVGALAAHAARRRRAGRLQG